VLPQKADKSEDEPERPKSGSASASTLALITSVIEVLRDRRFRFFDEPQLKPLFQAFFRNPQSVALQRMVQRVMQEQFATFLTSPVPEFHGNYPEKGKIPQDEKGWITIARLPVGDPFLAITPEMLTRNLLVVGATGSGKTTFTRYVAMGLLQNMER
jgi:predicted NACHT family NTPase